MSYKGYIAKIHFDPRDEIFVCRVENIQDIIAFDGQSVEELKQKFVSTIEAYFVDCADLGSEPNQPQKTRRKTTRLQLEKTL